MKASIQKLKTFLETHERILMPAFLAFGFLVDSITLRRVDLLPETILIYTYLSVAGLVIFLIHLNEEKKLPLFMSRALVPLFPLALSYVFGSLFSAFLIFYVKSASVLDSWPFILALLAVIVGWEVFKKHQTIFILHLTIFFLALFSFSIFSVPLWVGSIGTGVFFISLFVALALFSVFCYLLFLTGRKRFRSALRGLIVSVAAVAGIVVTLYATNVLPPIPLALKDIGVYHGVSQREGNFILAGEEYSFLDPILGITISLPEGKPLYVFSSVFTPVKIQTTVLHRWEYRASPQSKWVESARVSFPLRGGRDGGYRGYSMKTHVPPGLWRVSVETMDGLKIGRITFTVVESPSTPILVETTR